MLKSLLPARIGKLQIYNEYILSIYIDHFHFNAVLLKKNSSSLIVEKTFKHSFDAPDEAINRRLYFDKEKIKEAFLKLLKHVPKFDEIRIVLSSDLTIFKQLTLPFSDPEKISLLLPFEIKPHIAFDVEDLSMDFLITDILKDGQAELSIAAIRDVDLSKLISAIKESGLTCYNLGVDAFVLYELLKKDHFDLENISCFLEFGEKSLLFGFLEKKSLSKVKVFEFGLFDVVKNICKITNLEKEEVLKKLSEIGLLEESSDFSQKAKAEFLNIFKEVVFALEVFIVDSKIGNGVGSCIIFEGEFKIKDFNLFCFELTGMQSQYFSVSNWINIAKIHFNSKLEEENTTFFKPIAFVSVLEMSNFNIASKLLANPEKKIISKQVSISLCLIFFSICYLLASGFSEINKLSLLSVKTETMVINELKKILPADPKNNKKITTKKLLASTIEYLETRKSIQLLSGYSMPDFLAELFEVTRIIDRTRFGVIINNLSIKQDKEFNYKINLQGVFDQSKSSTESDNFMAFLRVLKLSRRLSLQEDVKYDGDEKEPTKNFSAILSGLEHNENNG
jgi:hypothetical protein